MIFIAISYIKDYCCSPWMITAHFLEQIAENRRADITVGSEFLPNFLSKDIYSVLICFLMMECDRLKLKKNTKFLAKSYFDTFLSQDIYDQKNLQLYLICCYRCAVKFNQSHEISQQFSLKICEQMCKRRFVSEQFLQAEEELLEILDYQLNKTTPYDFSITICQMLALSPLVIEKIQQCLDYAITLPSLYGKCSELLFFGCLLFYFSPQISQFHLILFQAQTDKWNDALLICAILNEAYNQDTMHKSKRLY